MMNHHLVQPGTGVLERLLEPGKLGSQRLLARRRRPVDPERCFEAIVDRRDAPERAAVDEDPILSLQAWERQVEYLHGVLQKDVDDFRAHLQEGYVVEE